MEKPLANRAGLQYDELTHPQKFHVWKRTPCTFDTGDATLKYGINWNLCGIQGSVVSITNSTFTGTYTNNALKLNQRNGEDDAATDVKPDKGDATPASIASATISNCTFSGTNAVIQLGSQGKGTGGAAAPSTGAFPVTIANTAETANQVKVECAWLAADKEQAPSVTLSADQKAAKTPKGDLIPDGTEPVARIDSDTYTSLANAVLVADPGSTIELQQNVTLTDGLDVDKKLTIDLNGHTVSKAGAGWTADPTVVDYLLAVKRGGDLTIKDSKGSGKIDAGDLACGVKMTIKGEAGNGDKAVLTVNGGTIQGKYYGISGNGTRHGTEITITGGTITATDKAGTAIYQPQNGSLTINGGEITSENTAIEIRSGELTVTGGAISGGNGEPTSTGNGSGTTTSNTGIAVAQHTTGKQITVTITGGTITGGAALYESNPQNNPKEDTNHVTITVQNAILHGSVALNGFADMGITNSAITGDVTKAKDSDGSLGFVNSTIKGNVTDEDSSIVYVNTRVNGEIKDQAGNNEAAVNGVPFDTLANAINAAQDGDTVILLKNVTVDGTSVVNNQGILTFDGKNATKNVIFDGRNHSITVTDTGTNTPSVINIQYGANVTVKNLTIDSDGKAKHGLNIYDAVATLENVTIKDGTGYGIVCNSSDLTVNGLTTSRNAWGGINIDTKVDGVGSAFSMTSGTIQEKNSVYIENAQDETISANISGGSFQNVSVANKNNSTEDVDNVTLTISGGRFANDVTDYLADGLVQDSNGNVEKPYIPPANPNYRIDIPAVEGGTVTADPAAAKAGATVTLTATPDEGYAVGTITVTDRFGDAVRVTEQADGTYTFVMPNGQVTVSATFVQTEEPAPAEPFPDVDENDWFYDEVVYVYENGLMNGVENNQFAPNTATNRAMLATILYRLAGQPDVSGDLPFTDVAAGTWYTDAVLWAAQNGIVNGLGENTFAPMNTLTREQLVTMLYRYAEAEGYDVSAAADLSGYPDAGKVQTYAQKAMSWAVAEGIVEGMDGNLNPAGNATRAQIATILMRFCEGVAK